MSSSQRSYRCSSALLTCIVALQNSCGLFFSNCDNVGHYSVVVTVSDSRTGQRPLVDLLLVLSDGQSADSVTYPAGSGPPVQLAAGLDRVGTFTVTVAAAGFATWTRSGVVVEYDQECEQGKTRRLSASLQPAP